MASPVKKVRKEAHTESAICSKSELDFISKRPYRQYCVEESQYVKIDPVSAITPFTNRVEFILPASLDTAWDLANCRLSMQVRITTKDGGAVVGFANKDVEGVTVPHDPVALSNSPLTTIWSKVEISIEVSVGYIYSCVELYLTDVSGHVRELRLPTSSFSKFY
jgi:hypothetical protein